MPRPITEIAAATPPLGAGAAITTRVNVRPWLAAAGVLFLAHVVYLNCVAEDAFIAFRFAKNLAGGHGLVWNIGEPPVEGYTDFLWVLLSAGAIRAGFDVIRFAQAAGVVAALATMWLVWRGAREHLELPAGAALVPVLLLAACGPFATWASSGMEMTLFTLLAFAGTFLVANEWRSRRPYAATAAAVVLACATLTRPEGGMIAAILLGVSIVAAMPDRRRLGAFAAASLVYAALVGVYFWWRYSRYGYLLPNTFYAKTGGGVDQVLRGGLLAFLFYMQFVVMPLVPFTLVAIWEYGLPRARPRLSGGAALLERSALGVFAALIVVAYTAYNIAVGGDYMAMHRFFVPVLPFLYLLFAIVAGLVYERKRSHAAGYRVLLAVTLAATFFPSTALERSFFFTPPQQHGDYRGVQTERWHVARLSTIGRFFDKYRRDSSESVATSAIGAIGYYADMRVLDMHGLVDTHIAHLPAPPDLGRRRPGHGREDLAYTLSLEPTYVMFSRDLTSTPIDLWRYVPEELRTLVDREYVSTSVWLDDPGNGESGYFTFFERRASAARRRAGRDQARGNPDPDAGTNTQQLRKAADAHP